DQQCHRGDKGAHGDEREDILNELGHFSLLYPLCILYVSILFSCQACESRCACTDVPASTERHGRGPDELSTSVRRRLLNHGKLPSRHHSGRYDQASFSPLLKRRALAT